MNVAICVCTYKRPDGLKNLLNSLQKLEMKSGSYKLFVADNDAVVHEGFNFIQDYGSRYDFEILCEIEGRPGISFARNRTVSMVKKSGIPFDYIAFTDDDIEVSSLWIRDLIETLDIYDADIVCGKSEPRYEYKPDPEVLFSPFYHDYYNNFPTGAMIVSGGTNNMLMKYDVIKDEGEELFDPRLATVGGEDADLSIRLINKGFKMVRCAAGVVYETFSADRLNLEWVFSRYYRYGTSYGFLTRKNFGDKKFLYITFKKSLLFPFRYIRALIFPTVRNKCGLRMEQGYFSFVLRGYLHQEYKS